MKANEKSKSMPFRFSMNFLLGSLMTISFTFIAFEWGTSESYTQFSYPNNEVIYIEQNVPVTIYKEYSKEMPPPPKLKFNLEKIVIGEDIPIIDESLEIDRSQENYSEEVKKLNIDIPEENVDPIPIYIVQEAPLFPGGEKALIKYLSKNLEYPFQASTENIEGRVFVEFVVEKDGSVAEVKVVMCSHEVFIENAIRVIREMPKWKPGKNNGHPVRVRMGVPIVFELR